MATTRLFALACLVWGGIGVLAQSGLSDLPTCAANCAQTAASRIGCDLNDVTCLCASAGFASAVLQCSGQAECTPEERSQVNQVIQGLCTASTSASSGGSSSPTVTTASGSSPTVTRPSSSAAGSVSTETVTVTPSASNSVSQGTETTTAPATSPSSSASSTRVSSQPASVSSSDTGRPVASQTGEDNGSVPLRFDIPWPLISSLAIIAMTVMIYS